MLKLQRSFYRSLQKKTSQIYEFYKGDMSKVSLAIFGNAIHPHYWSSLHKSPKQIIEYYFRNTTGALMCQKAQIAACFELIKRMNVALPESSDKKVLKPITLSREGMNFQVPCFQDRRIHPFPRFSVNGDPFWLLQKSLSLPAFVWRDEFVWMRDCSAQSALSTCTSCVTAKIEVSLNTHALGCKKGKNMFEYQVKIRNTGKPGIDPSCQILSRHWYFLDWASSELNEVVGSGVVGEFPVIHPGEEYSYSSATEIESTHGVMKGLFQVARFYQPSKAVDITPVLPSAKSRKKTNKTAKKPTETTQDDRADKFIDMIDVFIAPTLLQQ